jgi:magnesium chelatase family protein
MGTARTRSVALTGLDGHPVEILAKLSDGPAGLALAGLPETSGRQTRDRIRAAICNSGQSWPDGGLSVTFSPPVRSGHYYSADLAIAVAVLAAAGAIPAPPSHIALFGELSLGGQLQQIRGVLPAVQAAAAAGCTEVIVPADNAAEAALVPGVRVTGAANLSLALQRIQPAAYGGLPDLADLAGQQPAKHAAEVCAAGGHHLLLTGPPGCGQTLLAQRIPALMPPLAPAAALPVTALHSLADLLLPREALISDPPFIAPHHTATLAAILGGGAARPGAVSLAHYGVLFLDQAPEFGRDVLDALRQPLESGQVMLARGGLMIGFPADFTLVLSASRCPCARTGTGEACSCTPAIRRRYQARLAALLTRIDLVAELHPQGQADQRDPSAADEPTTVVAARVAAARGRTAARLSGTPWRLNARVPGAELRHRFPPAPGGAALLDRAIALGELSLPGAGRVLGVAWTLADLAGKPQPGAEESAEAVHLRLGRHS